MPEPPSMPPYAIGYQSTVGYGSAATLVRLAIIFNFILCALDGLYGLVMLTLAIVMPVMVARGPRSPGDPPPWVVGIIFGALAIPALAVSVVKLVASVKLLRSGKHAFGWGLAAGIVGCMQIWCSSLCVLPLACGIFTIVTMSLENVRAYLRDTGVSGGSGAAG